ncbi:hypothetical protein PoB_005453900 [Plakobranchus ocellatus]|uniref:Endonuclease/exonuclease/phosphatase domain-containing protein n=1 Tax=Plakobranchus ocellatus TaxID=259542 RepID=A0AAV4CBF7_9GAST|nr:hypothetical protein PoB_005453900 [Plakobranchus ocellatus]
MRADKECFRFNFGTFNVRGLSCEIKKHLITNAQSYGGTKVCSDHKLVKTTFELSKYNIWKPTTRKRNNSSAASRNRELLGRDSETTKKYTTHLSELLSENDPSQSAKYQWDYVKQSIETAVNTNTDLDTLRLIAEDRPKWNALVAEIRKTAEAARSDDPASGRL